MEQIARFAALILLLIGLIAMMVSIIIEVTKNIAILSKIPKDIKVVVLSLSLCIFAYFAYTSYTGIAIIWYFVIGTIIASFIVAFIVMYGWSKFSILYKKFRNIPTIDSTLNINADMAKNTIVESKDDSDDNTTQS